MIKDNNLPHSQAYPKTNMDTLFTKNPQLLIKINEFKRLVKKDTYLYHLEEKANNLFYIHSGSVNMGIHLNDKEIITSTLYSGEIFGEYALIESVNYKDFALAAEDSIISVIPTAVWSELSGLFPELTLFLMQLVLRRQKEVQIRLESVLFKDTKTRIVDYLLKCLDERGVKEKDHYLLPDMLTHQGIANWVSTSRQTVTLFLNELKEQSIIDFDRKTLVIYDLIKLKSFIK